MKFLWLGFVLTITMALNSCMKTYSPDVFVEKAIIQGPTGKFDLRKQQDQSKLVGGNEYFTIWISIFPIRGISYLNINTRLKTTINSHKTYYQLNGGEKLRLIIKRSKTVRGQFDITAPSSMDYFNYHGDGLHAPDAKEKIDSKHKKKMKKQTYRYNIPFTIDNENYFLDVTFRLKAKSSLRFGVFSMP